jgi:hypothetical protein
MTLVSGRLLAAERSLSRFGGFDWMLTIVVSYRVTKTFECPSLPHLLQFCLLFSLATLDAAFLW